MKSLLGAHIDRLGGLARNDMWELSIEGYDITLAVKNCPIPEMETEQVEVAYGNGKIYVAGKTNSPGTMDIALMDLLDADVIGTLVAWRELVVNPETGATGSPSEYKANGTLTRYANDGETVREIRDLVGLFPTTLSIGDGDYESGDPCEVTLTLSIDRAYRRDHSSVEATALD